MASFLIKVSKGTCLFWYLQYIVAFIGRNIGRQVLLQAWELLPAISALFIQSQNYMHGGAKEATDKLRAKCTRRFVERRHKHPLEHCEGVLYPEKFINIYNTSPNRLLYRNWL